MRCVSFFAAVASCTYTKHEEMEESFFPPLESSAFKSVVAHHLITSIHGGHEGVLVVFVYSVKFHNRLLCNRINQVQLSICKQCHGVISFLQFWDHQTFTKKCSSIIRARSLVFIVLVATRVTTGLGDCKNATSRQGPVGVRKNTYTFHQPHRYNFQDASAPPPPPPPPPPPQPC